MNGGDYNNGFFGEQLGGPARQRSIFRWMQSKSSRSSRLARPLNSARSAGGVINVIPKSGTKRSFTAASFTFSDSKR